MDRHRRRRDGHGHTDAIDRLVRRAGRGGHRRRRRQGREPGGTDGGGISGAARLRHPGGGLPGRDGAVRGAGGACPGPRRRRRGRRRRAGRALPTPARPGRCHHHRPRAARAHRGRLPQARRRFRGRPLVGDERGHGGHLLRGDERDVHQHPGRGRARRRGPALLGLPVRRAGPDLPRQPGSPGRTRDRGRRPAHDQRRPLRGGVQRRPGDRGHRPDRDRGGLRPRRGDRLRTDRAGHVRGGPGGPEDRRGADGRAEPPDRPRTRRCRPADRPAARRGRCAGAERRRDPHPRPPGRRGAGALRRAPGHRVGDRGRSHLPRPGPADHHVARGADRTRGGRWCAAAGRRPRRRAGDGQWARPGAGLPLPRAARCATARSWSPR